jgi:inorganic pyrophosphatase
VSNEKPDRDPEWVEVIVEIPKGSRNKYEMEHETGELWLDRHLFTATTYPADYGFVPDTLAEDGDPLDVLVLLEEPTVPGCHIRARPVGVFWMTDEKGPDAKVLAVPAGDPRWARVGDLDDVAEHLLSEIRHFFEVYKALEPAKKTDVGRWAGRQEAWDEIDAATERFRHGSH